MGTASPQTPPLRYERLVLLYILGPACKLARVDNKIEEIKQRLHG